ncbi:hypothetical protein O0I10_002591 [Lichtheimia ornata]|uniref:Transcription initiation factor TFIID subunit 10 n=1 Tax=Lichtheimia ornata TaxID=688661 RepID=A0AAD7VAV3_9FUNG|nr:uncharacterized protein O0I10_002591 [Lichtheimia ornata]KAJ8661783.1 hypothetical protein O0I10_002591 [Lichtheimia ornata]
MSDNHADSPATNSLTPMDLDVNAATTPEQQQVQVNPTGGSTEFQNPQVAMAAAAMRQTDATSMPPPPPRDPNNASSSAGAAPPPGMLPHGHFLPPMPLHPQVTPQTMAAGGANASGVPGGIPNAAAAATAAANNEPVVDPELAKKEKTLAEFLAMMDSYTPIIPDAVTDYYLSRTGFDCDDVRIKRLLALAAQKFVADIATDAFQYCKVRQSGNRKTGKDRKAVLTMDDLSAALGEYGVNVKKPDYYS